MGHNESYGEYNVCPPGPGYCVMCHMQGQSRDDVILYAKLQTATQHRDKEITHHGLIQTLLELC